MAAEFLSRVKKSDKTIADQNPLEIDENLVVPSAQGELLIITNGLSGGGTLLFPRRTCIADDGEFELYSSFYDIEGFPPGAARILSPAVVEKKSDGWVLRERGRLELVPSAEDMTGHEGSGHPPFSVADHLKKTKEKAIVKPARSRGLFVRDPKGEGQFVVTPGDGGSFILLPRLKSFLGRSGFQRYFDDFYKPYYDCAHFSAGDVWIVGPATVRRVKTGWRLLNKGVLEVREKPAQLELKPAIPENAQAPLPTINQAPVPTNNQGNEIATLTLQSATSSATARYFLAALLAMGVLTIAVLAWRKLWIPNSVATSESMPRVEAGSFTMGRNDGEENERPQHKVTVGPYSIDKYEVTREEYQNFVKATNHASPGGWSNGHFPVNTGRWPVTGVDWFNADAYCKWAGKRLPTEEEWELAARGTDGRKYPWGNDWQAALANAENASSGLTDVDKFTGQSPYGAIGMAGNAWEWTSSKLAPYPGGRIPPDELGNGQVDLRVIRGGSWQSKRTSATTTYRWGWPASGGSDYANTGFRCVKDS